MFESFFHFSKRPFAAQPDPESIFPAPVAEEAIRAIRHSLRQNAGISVLYGVSGVGKTLLLDRLARECEAEDRFILLSGRHLTNAKELLRRLARSLSLPFLGLDEGELRFLVEGTLELQSDQQDTSQKTVTGQHNEIAADGEDADDGKDSANKTKKRHCVFVLIDDAQNASVEALEEIRALSDRSTADRIPLRVLLAGTTSLEELLTLPVLEPFNQRIVCREYIEPFSPRECGDYIDWQIAAVTTRATAERFSEAAKKRIFDHTGGVARSINQLCETALFLAAEKEQAGIDDALVDAAWARSQRFRIPFVDAKQADSDSRGESQLDESQDDADIRFADHETGEMASGDTQVADSPNDLAEPQTLSPVEDPAAFADCDDTELASFDIDCTRTVETDDLNAKNQENREIDRTGSDTNNAENTEKILSKEDEEKRRFVEPGIKDFSEQEHFEATMSSESRGPEYVYDTTSPVVIQYPCYIDKNIAMLNWIAPGHRIASGTGTAYRNISDKDQRGRDVSIDKEPSAQSLAATSSSGESASGERVEAACFSKSTESVSISAVVSIALEKPGRISDIRLEKNLPSQPSPPLDVPFPSQPSLQASPQISPQSSPRFLSQSPSESPYASASAWSEWNEESYRKIVVRQNHGSTSETTLDEYFEDSFPVSEEAIPLFTAFSLSISGQTNSAAPVSKVRSEPSNRTDMPHLTESTVSREPSCLPLTLPSDIPSDIQSDTQGERGSLETAAELQRAVKQVVSAAERIEQAVCRFEHTGGKVDSTLDAIGTQIESLSEFHNQPSCRELFEQISELHQTVAEELAAIERKAAENSFAESQPSVMPETSDFRETRENDPESPISLKCTAPHEMEKPLSPPGGSIVRGFAGELRVSLPDGTKRRFDPGLAVKKPDMPGPIRRASLTRPNTNTPTGTDTTPDATKDAKNPEDTKQDEGLTEWKKASTPFKPNVEFRPRRRP